VSVQFSTWQNAEQPSQLCGVPTLLSQVSGNSTTPFPHTGQGRRQPVWPVAAQVGSGRSFAVGVTTPLILAGVLLGDGNVFTPSAPVGSVSVASTVPATTSCTRAVSSMVPALAASAVSRLVEVRFTLQPVMSMSPPTPQPIVRLQPPPPTSTRSEMETFPGPLYPASR